MKKTFAAAAALLAVSGLLAAAADSPGSSRLLMTGSAAASSSTQPGAIEDDFRPKQLSQQPAGDMAPNGLSDRIGQWIDGLAKEAAFHSWKDAEWNAIPLGPGTHSWLVVLAVKGRDVGYLVVGADQRGGYRLIEYGSGEYPLFGMAILYNTMKGRGLLDGSLTYDAFLASPFTKERLYFAPLESAWKVAVDGENLFFDAKNGELLPDLTSIVPDNSSPDENTTNRAESPAVSAGSEQVNDWKSAPRSADGEAAFVTERADAAPFNPAEDTSWLSGDAAVLTFAAITDLIKEGAPIIFTAELYKGKALYPFAVAGTQRWSDGARYVALEHDGPRYIRFEAADAAGQWYR